MNKRLIIYTYIKLTIYWHNLNYRENENQKD